MGTAKGAPATSQVAAAPEVARAPRWLAPHEPGAANSVPGSDAVGPLVDLVTSCRRMYR